MPDEHRYYPARAIVDLSAITDNVRALNERAGDAELMAVVKADAYGHGLLPCARAAIVGGATWLGVAQLGEAIALRDGLPAGTHPRILTWIYAPGAPFARAIEADIDLTASYPGAIEQIARAAEQVGRTARVQLKIDTGLGRGGSSAAQWEMLVTTALGAQAAGAIELSGIWSHFASADEIGHPTIAAQQKVFEDAVASAGRLGAQVPYRHLANSAALLSLPQARYDLVRPGLAIYGLSPLPGRSSGEFGLRPAMRLEADLILTKQVRAGTGISYGHTYHTATDTTLALVPLGYGDGIPRHASNQGPVQVGGRRVSIAGRICMDQFVLDLGPDAPEQAGQSVVLFGSGADGEPTAQDWAQAADTISYEIVTRIGRSVPRVYLGGSEGTQS